MRDSSVGGRVLGGLFWAFSGTLAQAVLQVIVMMVMARLLAPATFGAVAAALVVIKVAGFISNLGLAGALIQREDLEDRHIETAFATLVQVGLVTCLLIELGAPWIAAFFRIDAVEPVVRLLAIAIPLSNASQVALGLMRRDLMFRQVATFAVVAFVVGYGLVGIGLAVSGFGLWALAGAHVAQTACNTILLLHFRPHPRVWVIRWKPLSELLRFAGGMVGWRTATNIALEADNLVVGRWLGAEALGLYSRAYWLAATPASLFGRGIGNVLFPTLSRFQDDRRRLALAYRRGITATNLVAVPASAVIAILAPEMVDIVLGDQWGSAVAPLQILAFGLLFRLSARVSDSLTGAVGAVYRTAGLQTVYAVAVFVGALIGQHWGIEGVATGVLGALLLNYALMSRLALQLSSLPLAELMAAFVPGVLSTLVISVGLVALRAWLVSENVPSLIILIAAMALVGIVAAVLLRIAPRIFLGEDGIWAVHLVLRNLPRSISSPASRLIAPSARPT
jgi:O-antigen/teichoic acid export membrane protein